MLIPASIYELVAGLGFASFGSKRPPLPPAVPSRRGHVSKG